MGEEIIIYPTQRLEQERLFSKCHNGQEKMNVHWQVKCLIIYHWKWNLPDSGFIMYITWYRLPPGVHYRELYSLLLPLGYTDCTRMGRNTGRNNDRTAHRKRSESVECWDTYLFLLVLALGAISGVRTYKLLFLGRCKLLSTVWLSKHNHTWVKQNAPLDQYSTCKTGMWEKCCCLMYKYKLEKLVRPAGKLWDLQKRSKCYSKILTCEINIYLNSYIVKKSLLQKLNT